MLIPSCISDWSENSHQESSWTEFFCTFSAACIRAVVPFFCLALTFTPFLMSNLSTSSWPPAAASSVKDMPLESCRCQRKHKTFKDVHMTSSQQRDQGMAALQKPQLVSASRCSKYTILIQKVCFFIDSIQILHYIILDVLTKQITFCRYYRQVCLTENTDDD